MTGVEMAWLQSQSVGEYGYTVLLYERTPGRLYLRYGKPHQTTALRHGDWERGLREATELAATLMVGTQKPEKGRALIRQLLTRYFTEVSRHKKAPQPREEARRVAIWATFLPSDTRAEECTPDLMRRFALARRNGRIKLPNVVKPARQLSTRVSETTIGHDIAFLQFVLTWAHEKGFIARNPLLRYQRPKTANPLRPVATYDRYLKIRERAERVEPRFAVFMDLTEGLGWRRGAIRQLKGSDFDRKAIPEVAPWGRIRKSAETDKQHTEAWIPMSKEVRQAVDLLGVVGDAYLFPSPKRPGKPWRGEYCRDLLERCELAAELEPQRGGMFHPYRRKWATERKHLPTADVMKAGGWRDRKTLETCYQQADDRTILAVVSEPTKLREIVQ